MTVGHKRRRLSRSAEFDRVYRHGRSAASRYFVVYAFPRERSSEMVTAVVKPDSDADGARLGVSVGRRVGSAVVRNRVKRLVRAAFWSLVDMPDDHDYVVVARPDAAQLAERDGLTGIAQDLRELVGRLGFRQGGGDAASA